jgi:iron complex outermembrane receptor protein
MSSNFSHKNLSVGFSARANIGNYVYNNFNSNNGAYRNATVFPTSLSNVSTNVLETNFVNNQYFSDYYLENASFLRIDNIYLGYGLQNILGSKLDARVTASVQNAFVHTKYSGRDPELTNGIDNDFYPRPRIFALGVNVDF